MNRNNLPPLQDDSFILGFLMVFGLHAGYYALWMFVLHILGFFRISLGSNSGYWMLRSMIFICFTQLAYILPFYAWSIETRRQETVKGILAGATVTLLISSTCGIPIISIFGAWKLWTPQFWEFQRSLLSSVYASAAYPTICAIAANYHRHFRNAISH
jgi:hypothetical protein